MAEEISSKYDMSNADDAVLDLMQKWNNLAKGSLNHSLKLQVAQLLLFLP